MIHFGEAIRVLMVDESAQMRDLLVRLLADDPAGLRSAVMELVCGIRHSAGGLPPRVPRVWHC